MFTWLSFGSALPSKVAQFSVGANTFMGPKKGEKIKNAGHHRTRVLSLVERDGKTRSFHVANVDGKNLKPIIMQNIAKDSHLMTDGAGHYKKIGQEFDLHESTNHTQKEYAKDSKVPGVRAHSNTVESYFGIPPVSRTHPMT